MKIGTDGDWYNQGSAQGIKSKSFQDAGCSLLLQWRREREKEADRDVGGKHVMYSEKYYRASSAK